MSIRKLAGLCEDRKSCSGVWEDDRSPEDAIIVGQLLEPSPVSLGPGEAAIRLSK